MYIILGKNGYIAENVEKDIRLGGPLTRKRDLFNFADLIAFNGKEVLLIQVCAKSSIAARRAKIYANETADKWASSNHRRILIWGWHQEKKGGRWQLTEEIIDPMLFPVRIDDES